MTNKRFKKIDHYYQSLEGWFNMEEQYLELLDETPEGGTFVELGCYKGKSTSFIGVEIHKRKRDIDFFAVDSFMGATNSTDENEVKAYVGISDIEQTYNENVAPIGNKITTIKSLSHEASQYFEDKSVDVIFIDAGHSREAVKKDIDCWLPKMKPNGIMAGHDYTAWDGVNRAVKEIFSEPHKVENDCWFIYLSKLF
jgi:predicted O-methyltransferase YrrM